MEIVRDWAKRSGMPDGVKFKVNTATRLWQRALGESKSSLSEMNPSLEIMHVSISRFTFLPKYKVRISTGIPIPDAL